MFEEMEPNTIISKNKGDEEGMGEMFIVCNDVTPSAAPKLPFLELYRVN